MTGNQLAPGATPLAEFAGEGLEAQLMQLTQYGKPALSMVGGKGWYARIDMHVTSKGATFEVASEFDMPTPQAAVDQLIDRVERTLKNLQ